jgi:hypothetical protein
MLGSVRVALLMYVIIQDFSGCAKILRLYFSIDLIEKYNGL